MIVKVQLKKIIASTTIFGIVVDKVGYRQEFCQVILFEINKNSEVNFFCIILLLNLAISLNIKGSKKP